MAKVGCTSEKVFGTWTRWLAASTLLSGVVASVACAGDLQIHAVDVPFIEALWQTSGHADTTAEAFNDWNDANPPFDLAEFLKAPPDEENAAPLYLDALFEFEELSDCYVPKGLKWAQYPDEVKRRAEIARQRPQER